MLKEAPFPTPWPWLLALHQAKPKHFPHLLVSAAGGRFSILFALPSQTETFSLADGDFFLHLDARWQAARVTAPALTPQEHALPFRGGWFFYLAYEAAAFTEKHLHLLPQPSTPLAILTRFPAAIIYDQQQQQSYFFAENQAQMQELETAVAEVSPAMAAQAPTPHLSVFQEENPEVFLREVQKILNYIAAGDIFQANLSRLWSMPLPCAPADLFRALLVANPAPFAALATFADLTIISASPERLLSMDGQGQVSMRPIAGTLPRLDSVTDLDVSAFVQDPKERAEHIMLVDLIRNDLGRIAEVGSVQVAELLTVEHYRHVHHLVSAVQAKTKATPGQALKAVFPSGTITGCPKVRAMEILAASEQSPRGPYTGSVGYLNHDGRLDSNILIRSFWQEGEMLFWRTGAGIVADSLPEKELRETRAKALGLCRAIAPDFSL
jgi:anthranilate synthase component 1